ncbi:hypothetical protein [Streptomyces melanogenes]|nr:hypothetical protein [Streptomyces melanogenes]
MELGRVPAWECRRPEQGTWWHLFDATLLSDPPVALAFDRTPGWNNTP